MLSPPVPLPFFYYLINFAILLFLLTGVVLYLVFSLLWPSVLWPSVSLPALSFSPSLSPLFTLYFFYVSERINTWLLAIFRALCSHFVQRVRVHVNLRLVMGDSGDAVYVPCCLNAPFFPFIHPSLMPPQETGTQKKYTQIRTVRHASRLPRLVPYIYDEGTHRKKETLWSFSVFRAISDSVQFIASHFGSYTRSTLCIPLSSSNLLQLPHFFCNNVHDTKKHTYLLLTFIFYNA